MALSPVASFFQTTGLAVVASQPLWVGSGLVDDKLHLKLDGYDHQIIADGGFWAATIPIKAQPEIVEDWYKDGLGRHIEVFDEAGDYVFEGVVNEVEAGVSALTARRGPLLEVDNQVKVAYRTISYDTVPPIGGQEAITAAADNEDSQALYAIQEAIVNGGERSSDQALQLRNTYLADRAWPQMSNDLDLGGANEAIARLTIAGYVRFLDRYSYSYTAAGGTINASAKVQSVLAADPNGLYSNYNRLDANTYQVGQYENDNQRAWTIIQGIVEDGDASDNRWTFGVYARRLPIYTAVPTGIEYFEKIRSPFLQLERADTSLVMPWNVRPARWAQISDWLAGATNRSNQFRRDQRNQFIESVRFTAPGGLSINGGRVNRIDQALAKVN